MRLRDFTHRLISVPFKPFKIHPFDGSSISVREVGTMILGKSSAVIPTEFEKEEDVLPSTGGRSRSPTCSNSATWTEP